MENCPHCGLPRGTCSCRRLSGSFGRFSSDNGYVPARRTIRTKCRFCGAPVLYHTNEHGSKVFFDPPPGKPWPKHECEPWIRRVQREPLVHPATTRFDRAAVQNAEYERLLRSAWDTRSGRLWKPDIVSRNPEIGLPPVREVGVVHEVVAVLNPFRKLELSDENPMARAMLGARGRARWGQIGVHVDDLGSGDEPAIAYQMLVDQALLADLGLRKEDTVQFVAEAGELGFRPMWFCRLLEIL